MVSFPSAFGNDILFYFTVNDIIRCSTSAPMVLILGPGHEHFRDTPRPDHPPHDGHSPASRERSSSLQGMDMASLPPRKRPWHDGPGTSEHREMEAPGGPSEDRGSKGRGRSAVPGAVGVAQSLIYTWGLFAILPSVA